MKIIKNPEHKVLNALPFEREKEAWATPDVILLEDVDIGSGIGPIPEGSNGSIGTS